MWLPHFLHYSVADPLKLPEQCNFGSKTMAGHRLSTASVRTSAEMNPAKSLASLIMHTNVA
jgi:hypothetical protein